MSSIMSIQQSHSSTSGFPLRLFAIAFVISLLATIFSGWQSWQMHNRSAAMSVKHIALTAGVGRIMQLDEVLTMSARMAAATGDFGYEKRYDQFDPQLTADIDEVRALLPQPEIVGFIGETDEANLALAKMERQAFALTHQGKRQEATALLVSDEYTRLKKVYAGGMQKTINAAKGLIEKDRQHFLLLSLWLAAASLVGVLALLAAWFYAARSARSWAAERRESEDALQQAHDGLEAQVEQRTAELLTTNEKLQREISEHEVAEIKNQQLAQLYTALSLCNKAIVHCASEEELFSLICRDAVQFGGMKMVWIGLVDEPSKRVKHVAAYGDGAEYLQSIQISTDANDPSGHGPVATSIRENQPFWCQDFQNDPTTTPWHESGSRFGWGAAASLPLHRNGEVIGCFTLHAGETNAFDEATRNLLLEMAMDMSFALGNFTREAQLKLAAKVFEQGNEGFIITDAKRNIVMLNHAVTVISGYSEAEVLGQDLRMLVSGGDDEDFYRAMWKKIDKRGSWQGEVSNHRKDGSLYPGWFSVSRALDAQGNVTHIIGIFNDITKHKEAEAHINQLVNFDALTGLPNRILLTDRINQAISIAQRNSESLTLMFLDLDHFKNVNDSLGHHIGDELLIQLAKRLKALVREEDTVSRMGGDEFIMVLKGADVNGATHVAKKLLEVIAQPYLIGQYELIVTPSIGIALYPNDGEDFDTLFKCADVAMYRAKKSGRNNYCFFTPEMQESSIRTLQLENALRHAVEFDQLVLHYQPQVSLESGRVIGAEALVRWQHPEFGLVPPAEFIPISEETGQILQIGEWVLRTAIRQMKAWIDSGLGPMIIAVNLSSVQFRHLHLPELVTQILEEEQLPPEYLELELTESVAMDNPIAAIGVMNNLHERGIRMSIDDFGTGYSSLSYLKRFQIYKLKIDQSFVRDITVDADDKAIVSAIISLAKSLGMKTIAEGVETEGQLAYLREKCCDEVQGYFYSKPLPTDQFEAFVKSSRQRATLG